MKKKLVIIGSGGHGRVIADAIMLTNEFDLVGFADDNAAIGENVIGDFKVIAKIEETEKLKNSAEYFIVAIGNNEIRKKLTFSLTAILKPATIIHPFSSVSKFAKIGTGTVVLAGAVISANAIIGENCIINTQALVDHDSTVGRDSHISQGAIIGSHSSVKELSVVATGQVVKD